MKKWHLISKIQNSKSKIQNEEIIQILLENRGLKTKKEIEQFLNPPDPHTLTCEDVAIDVGALHKTLERIQRAIKDKESMVVYSDYDADGITAGAIMWESLHILGAKVMPYVPHRVNEGYGLSVKGLDNVKRLYNPSLIITVDHGITAWEKIKYAQSIGIEVIVTDHHVKPHKRPDCLLVHTTKLCGAGVSWFVAKQLLKKYQVSGVKYQEQELLALAAIGTIADMVPLVGPNRSIVTFGLHTLNETQRIGLKELIMDAGLVQGEIGTYGVSHMLAPRLNAMGRLVHALDALRLLCTKQVGKAKALAQTLGSTNRERQQLTIDTFLHAKDLVISDKKQVTSKLLFITHSEYNLGVIGLVAGKLVEEFYRPAIVVAQGEIVSKASARSIAGFNIIEAIRSCSDLLVDAGGHPMAAGFTVETAKLELLKKRLEDIAGKELDEKALTRVLKIDLEIPLEEVSEALWIEIQKLAPFGIGNPEPVFVSKKVVADNLRLIGRESKHLKLKIKQLTTNNQQFTIDAVGFGMGDWYEKLDSQKPIDIAYTIDMNKWNGNSTLQLKLKDIHSS